MHKYIALLFISDTVHSTLTNFTLPGNHILEDVLNSADLGYKIYEVLNHGCWCGRLAVSTSAKKTSGGHPVDAIDLICREWSLCSRCVKTEGYCDSSRMHYIAINSEARPWTCNFPQTDFCAKERCVCDLNAALGIKGYLKNYNQWVSSPNCPTHKSKSNRSLNPVPKNRCCKAKAIWIKYSNETHSCNEELGKLVLKKPQKTTDDIESMRSLNTPRPVTTETQVEAPAADIPTDEPAIVTTNYVDYEEQATTVSLDDYYNGQADDASFLGDDHWWVFNRRR